MSPFSRRHKKYVKDKLRAKRKKQAAVTEILEEAEGGEVAPIGPLSNDESVDLKLNDKNEASPKDALEPKTEGWSKGQIMRWYERGK